MNMRTDRRSRPSSTRSPRLLSSVIGKWKWQPQSFNAHFTTQTLNKVKRDERGLFNVRACEVGLGGSCPSLSPGITTWMTIWLSMSKVVFFSKFWVQWNAALILCTRFLFFLSRYLDPVTIQWSLRLNLEPFGRTWPWGLETMDKTTCT